MSRQSCRPAVHVDDSGDLLAPCGLQAVHYHQHYLWRTESIRKGKLYLRVCAIVQFGMPAPLSSLSGFEELPQLLTSSIWYRPDQLTDDDTNHFCLCLLSALPGAWPCVVILTVRETSSTALVTALSTPLLSLHEWDSALFRAVSNSPAKKQTFSSCLRNTQQL